MHCIVLRTIRHIQYTQSSTPPYILHRPGKKIKRRVRIPYTHFLGACLLACLCLLCPPANATTV
ncbi:hypothetical protein LY78DRAFT_297018 [Colletotrichum sublineola]|nr:hypothetical protein LY78DRAFT_297018 [Colletotrichum sublineola]